MPAELTGDLQTLLTGAAFAPISDRAFLRITGADATRWLNGMVTNSIQALQPGEGNYNFILNAQGRIQGDCTIYRTPEAEEPAFLLETDTTQLEAIQQLLDRFIIMDDVELTPLDSYTHGLHLLGPAAPQIVSEIVRRLGSTTTSFGPLRLLLLDAPSVLVTSPAAGSLPRFYIASASPIDELRTTAQQAGAVEATPVLLEAARILEGRPRYATDIRNTDGAKDLPQETNQSHALHFAKGCYVGQEIVERIRSRGQVHRLFTPFRLEGTPPATFPTPLEANGKPAGEITSAAVVQTTEGPVTLALGYARREALEAKANLTYAGGTVHPRSPGSLN